MTIYVDIVLAENVIMNCIILIATAVILKIKIKICKNQEYNRININK